MPRHPEPKLCHERQEARSAGWLDVPGWPAKSLGLPVEAWVVMEVEIPLVPAEADTTETAAPDTTETAGPDATETAAPDTIESAEPDTTETEEDR